MSIRYFRVEGGHDGDPDPEQAGRVRLRDIALHGENVRTEDLPFSQMLTDASGSGSFQFNRPPLPGTLVVAWVPPGAEHTGYAHVIGTPIGIDKPGSKEIPGNSALPNRMALTDILVKIPPKIKAAVESNRSGIEKNYREVVEKGKRINFSLLQGIPNHGAEFLMSGLRNSPLTQISTALDTFDSILSSSIISQLPGFQFGGLGDIMSLIPDEILGDLEGAIGGELMQALNNIQQLMPSELGSMVPTSGFMAMGRRVNPDTIVDTLVSTIQGATGHGSLVEALRTIEQGLTDSSFTGMDQFAPITNILAGGFGNITQSIDAFGNISNTVESAVEALESLFTGKIDGILNAAGSQLLTSSGTPLKSLAERIPNAGIVKTVTDTLANFTDDNPKKKRMRSEGNQNGKGVTAETILSTFTDRLGDDLGFTPAETGQTSGGVYA